VAPHLRHHFDSFYQRHRVAHRAVLRAGKRYVGEQRQAATRAAYSAYARSSNIIGVLWHQITAAHARAARLGVPIVARVNMATAHRGARQATW
jgi:hypothetical protein